MLIKIESDASKIVNRVMGSNNTSILKDAEFRKVITVKGNVCSFDSTDKVTGFPIWVTLHKSYTTRQDKNFTEADFDETNEYWIIKNTTKGTQYLKK